jgi:hypothetical protein
LPLTNLSHAEFVFAILCRLRSVMGELRNVPELIGARQGKVSHSLGRISAPAPG